MKRLFFILILSVTLVGSVFAYTEGKTVKIIDCIDSQITILFTKK